jgi:hypothetical protein
MIPATYASRAISVGAVQTWHVFEVQEPRTASVGDVKDVEEEAAALAIEASTPARQAEVLAREARNDAVHRSSPASSVEGE